jgi:hypothetical protein
LVKIAENCDHNIDPSLGEFKHIGQLFNLSNFFKNYRISLYGWASFFHEKSFALVFAKKSQARQVTLPLFPKH